MSRLSSAPSSTVIPGAVFGAPWSATPRGREAPEGVATALVPADVAAAATGGLAVPHPVFAEALTPEQIKRQQEQMEKTLDKRMEELREQLTERIQRRTQKLEEAAEQHKKCFALQVDEQAMVEKLQLSREHNDAMMELHQTMHQQKLALKQQATALLLEYHHREAQKDMDGTHRESHVQLDETRHEHRRCLTELVEEHAPGAARTAEARRASLEKLRALETEQAQLARMVASHRQVLWQLRDASSEQTALFKCCSRPPVAAASSFGAGLYCPLPSTTAAAGPPGASGTNADPAQFVELGAPCRPRQRRPGRERPDDAAGMVRL